MQKGSFKPRAGRFFTNATMVMVSLLVSLFAVEGLLRLNSPPDLCCQHDPLFGWSKKPNSTVRNVTREYETTERLNSKGLRGPEYPYDKAEDEYRILILGDSFAEGYTVEFQELFSENLKKKLNAREERHYEVINSGTRGYSTVQELLFFKHEGRRYRPDLTVLMFYENDVWDNTQNIRKNRLRPFYKLIDNRPRLMNFPVPLPASGKEKVINDNPKEYDQNTPRKLKDWLDTNSHLYRLVRSKIRDVPHLYRLAIRLGLATSPLENPTVGIWRKKYRPETRDAWKITEAALMDVKREVDSIGSRLLVFYIPFKFGVNEDAWRDIKRRYGFSDEEWDLEKVGRKLDSFCKEKNLVCLNPTELFQAKDRELLRQGKRFYFVEDMHWTTEGHRYVGEILAQFITSNFLATNIR
jgi:lysophospholipase L1-like esterase